MFLLLYIARHVRSMRCYMLMMVKGDPALIIDVDQMSLHSGDFLPALMQCSPSNAQDVLSN